MDSLIEIKFSSLKKQVENVNNYTIEIIPNISNVQNLDLLNFDETNDCIEYSLPIIYKIILKKINDSPQID